MIDKKILRQQMRLAKKRLTPQQWHDESLNVIRQIESLPAFQLADSFMAYFPLPDELDIRPLLTRWLGKKRIFLPVIADGDIQVKEYLGDDCLSEGSYHILEPSGSFYSSSSHFIPFIIVPGIAFTSDGKRLGRGKGYYDRFLLSVPNAFTVGVGLSCQLVPDLPLEPHDVILSQVITPLPLEV